MFDVIAGLRLIVFLLWVWISVQGERWCECMSCLKFIPRFLSLCRYLWLNRRHLVFSFWSCGDNGCCVESLETVKLLLKDVFCRKMLKIEEDWGDAGVVDDRFCHPCVSPRPLDPWLSLFEVKQPAAPQRSGQEGHLVTRTTLPRVICHHFAFPTIFTQAACVCVCVCFQDIHKINTSWHAKDQTAPQDFSFEFPCLLAGNSWVDGSSLVSESVALGDIWQNLLPRFAYKLPHPPAAMSQPPKNQHHMWLPLELPHTHLLESGNKEAINILSIRPHRRPTVRLTNSCERTAENSTATSLNLNLWLTLFSLAYLSISTNWGIILRGKKSITLFKTHNWEESCFFHAPTCICPPPPPGPNRVKFDN